LKLQLQRNTEEASRTREEAREEASRTREELALEIARTREEVQAIRLFDKFDWTEARYTHCRSRSFVSNVLRFYNARANCAPGERWCLVLGQKLYNVTVSHLFKYQWHDDIDVVGLQDIDDVRNGLPMFKPIEWAFDSSRLCFYIPDGEQKLTVKLLDKSIAGLRLYEKGEKLCGAQWSPHQPRNLSNMTFQQLDGRHLTFDSSDLFALNRPCKRILCLHAKAARRHAIRKGLLMEGEWLFSDFSSEGLSASEKICAWK